MSNSASFSSARRSSRRDARRPAAATATAAALPSLFSSGCAPAGSRGRDGGGEVDLVGGGNVGDGGGRFDPDAFWARDPPAMKRERVENPRPLSNEAMRRGSFARRREWN